MAVLRSVARLAQAVALSSVVALTGAGLARSLVREGRLPERVPNAMAAANRDLQQGRWPHAAAQYRAVVAINRSERNAWFYLGLALACASDRDGFVEARAAALAASPSAGTSLADGANACSDWRRLTPAQRRGVQGGGS